MSCLNRGTAGSPILKDMLGGPRRAVLKDPLLEQHAELSYACLELLACHSVCGVNFPVKEHSTKEVGTSCTPSRSSSTPACRENNAVYEAPVEITEFRTC